MNNLFETWCQKATEQIRYTPDRRLVMDELMAHMEDAYEAQIHAGLSPDEAAQKVLSSMGNSDAIAPQLAAVHTPWLGYIYRLVRALAVTLAVFSIFVGLINFGDFVYGLVGSRNYESIPSIHSSLDYYCQPNVSAWSDGYRFQVNETGYSRSERALYFDLEVIYWPWMDLNNATSYIWAVDSLGNYYDSRAEQESDDPTRVNGGGGSGGTMLFVYSMEIVGFNCDAQWVELHYDRDGRDLVLRIDLTGGVEHE